MTLGNGSLLISNRPLGSRDGELTLSARSCPCELVVEIAVRITNRISISYHTDSKGGLTPDPK